MSQDLSELVAYLDKKFQDNNANLDAIKLNMATSKELEIFMKENNQDHTELKEAMNTLTSSIDRLTK